MHAGRVEFFDDVLQRGRVISTRRVGGRLLFCFRLAHWCPEDSLRTPKPRASQPSAWGMWGPGSGCEG